MSRETVTRWRRRNPELRRWLYEHIGKRAEELRPLVDRRVTQLAISGSADHAKLFYQFVAKVGDPDHQAGTVINNGMTLNLLVPRPDPMLQLTSGIVQPPAILGTGTAIPRLRTR